MFVRQIVTFETWLELKFKLYFIIQINEAQHKKVLGLIATGVQEGATLKYGGKNVFDEGFFIQPTVFADVTDQMTIAKQEVSGFFWKYFQSKSLLILSMNV